MRLTIFKRTFISAFLWLLMFHQISNGQAFRFRNYGTEKNIPSKVVYTIAQDRTGFLWVGTTEGLARFDGFEFSNVLFPDSATTRYATASFKDRDGNLWFGCNDGTVFYNSGRNLKKVTLPNSSGTGISAILQRTDGFIYIIPQRKPLFRIDPSKPSEAIEIFVTPQPASIFSAAFTGTGKMMLGTQENIMVCKFDGDTLVSEEEIAGFDYSSITAVQSLNSDATGFIIGTDGNGLFHLQIKEGKNILSRFKAYPALETITVKAAGIDSERNLWISTKGEGVFKMQLLSNSDSIISVQHLDKSSGLPGEIVNTIFQDVEGNIWMGFNGDGLSMLISESLSFVIPGTGNLSNNIITVRHLGSNYLLGTTEGYYTYDLSTGKTISFTHVKSQTGNKEASCFYVDNDDNVWIGTKGAGLYLRNNKGITERFYRTGDSGADFINDINIGGDNIWLATLNGVIVISKKTGLVKKTYKTDDGLPFNNINQIMLSEDGSGYIATQSDRIIRVNPDSGIVYSDMQMNGVLLNKIQGFAFGDKGTIWAATSGNGVFECYRDSIKSLTTANGLLSNYSYSILSDVEGNIWIGHERGVSRYNPKNGLVKVFGTDFAKGATCNSNAIFESSGGKILIGTTEGLIVYDRTKESRDQHPPLNNINFITINDSVYPFQPSFSLPYKKRYNIKISFSGISFSDPEKVFYSTYLEGYDPDWTEPSSSRSVTYNLMRDGKYKFNLVSVNADGLTQENPLTFEINIKSPIWRAWWFILLLMAAGAGIVILIIRQREKAQKKLQEYLEKELDARTEVVVKQKAVLEVQNLEITDSINYARRIQSSILPDIKRIREHFSDAFIMFHPRDIVSGDFYWFDKLDDDTFILVCADSTGHGVPGAFMSMIGATLLQDIVSRQRISKPSEILSLLDKQIFSTLNQNLELGVSNDGMDIIVCEFTLKNRHIRFASAMRPVLIIMGGESYYIKGNRASVGGQTTMEKYFDDQEYYLNEGDMIYLFTDGLPDQFGGPEGKKMKIARLKDHIMSISALPLEKQEHELDNFYNEWKGTFEQVDDILFMGVKV